MSDTFQSAVLYTDHAGLTATVPGVAALWSYETCMRDRRRGSVALRPDGSREYWLERSDPLLNTMLPGTGLSVVVNFGDLWTAGRRLPHLPSCHASA
jgi:hypothetical protein